MFLSFPDFAASPNHLTVVPVDGPVMAALQFRSFPLYSTSRCLRFLPAISQLIHFMFLSFPELCFMFLSYFRTFRFFRFGRLTINPFRVLAFPKFSGLSGLFPTTRLTIVGFRVPVLSGFVQIFPTFPDLSGRDKIGLPLISGFFRLFPDACGRDKIGPFMFLSFPDFSEFFRMCLALTKLFPFMCLSFPDFSGCF